MKYSSWIIVSLLVACAPPASKKVAEVQTFAPDTPQADCALVAGGVCADVRWVTPVTSARAGEIEVTWRSTPPEHLIFARVTMDCCGSEAPSKVVVTVVDPLHERISGIQALGGKWTVSIRVLTREGNLLGKTEGSFEL